MHKSTFPAVAVVLLLVAGPALAGWEEGVAAFKNKDCQAAATEFGTVVEQNPDAHSGHYMLGLSYKCLNKKEDALNHLRKAYDLNPNDVSYKFALGQAYFDVRRYGDAAKLLGTIDNATVDKLDARRKGALLKMRAASREQSGDENGAYVDYRLLAGLNPQDAQVQHKYGILASNRDQMDEASNALDRAHRAAGSDEGIKRSFITVLKKMGRMARDKNDKKRKYLQAANLAKELVRLNGSHENLLLQCEVELGASLYADAVKSCGSASAKKQNDWLAHFYLGQAYSSNGQFAEAEGPLNTAAGLASGGNDKKQIARQLGFVYEKQKKYAESIAKYEDAGDRAGVARVQENERTAKENASIEAENRRIEQMQKEAEELEKQLKELEGGGGGRR